MPATQTLAEKPIIGKEVIVNGRSYMVIGVAPQGFYGTEVVSAPDLFFSIAMQEQLELGNTWLANRGAGVGPALVGAAPHRRAGLPRDCHARSPAQPDRDRRRPRLASIP